MSSPRLHEASDQRGYILPQGPHAISRFSCEQLVGIGASFEQTTNAMAALTLSSIVSALATVPTSLENFAFEICRLRGVRYRQRGDLPQPYIFFISLSLEARSLW
jgi:hypothetical protein